MTGRTLTAVTRAARRRAQATDAYRHAIETARQDGHTLARIAAAAGVTRQEIHRITTRKDGKP